MYTISLRHRGLVKLVFSAGPPVAAFDAPGCSAHHDKLHDELHNAVTLLVRPAVKCGAAGMHAHRGWFTVRPMTRTSLHSQGTSSCNSISVASDQVIPISRSTRAVIVAAGHSARGMASCDEASQVLTPAAMQRSDLQAASKVCGLRRWPCAPPIPHPGAIAQLCPACSALLCTTHQLHLSSADPHDRTGYTCCACMSALRTHSIRLLRDRVSENGQPDSEGVTRSCCAAAAVATTPPLPGSRCQGLRPVGKRRLLQRRPPPLRGRHSCACWLPLSRRSCVGGWRRRHADVAVLIPQGIRGSCGRSWQLSRAAGHRGCSMRGYCGDLSGAALTTSGGSL